MLILDFILCSFWYWLICFSCQFLDDLCGLWGVKFLKTSSSLTGALLSLFVFFLSYRWDSPAVRTSCAIVFGYMAAGKAPFSFCFCCSTKLLTKSQSSSCVLWGFALSVWLLFPLWAYIKDYNTTTSQTPLLGHCLVMLPSTVSEMAKWCNITAHLNVKYSIFGSDGVAFFFFFQVMKTTRRSLPVFTGSCEEAIIC